MTPHRPSAIVNCVFGAMLVTLALGPHRAAGQNASSRQSKVRPELVEVETVCSENIGSEARFVATVVPTRRSVIGAAVEGRVESFLFNPEQPDGKLTKIASGEVLAQLKTDTIARELGVAQADLALRQQELAELHNGTRPEEVAAALAHVKRWQAGVEYAQARYRRVEQLFNAKTSVSLDQLEEARLTVAQAEQSLLEANAKYDLAVAGPRIEQIAQAEARVESQRQTVHRLEGILGKYTVRSPFDGYVVKEFTELGAWVSAGDPIAEVIQLEPLEVEANLPQAHIPDVVVGEAAQVQLMVMPERMFPGRVERIVPQADIRSRTFPIRIRLDDSVKPESHRIMAGMLGHVIFSLQDPQTAKLVPKDAIVLDGGSQTVVVVQPLDSPLADGAMGTARLVPVELGVPHGSSIEVRGDLNVGDLIVTRGNERLRANQPLYWKNAPQSSPTSARSEASGARESSPSG